MKEKKEKKTRKPGIVRILRKNMKSLVQFELFYKFLFLAVFIPLISKVITLSLNVTGYKYLTVENFSGYLTHPLTIVFGFLLLLLVAIFHFYDISAIIYNADMSYQNEKTNISEMFRFGFSMLRKFFRVQNIIFFLLIDLLIPFMSIGVAWSYFRMISLSDLILAEISKKWYYGAIAVVGIAGIWIFLMRFVYSFHYFCIDGTSYFRACKRSCRLSKKNRLSDLVKLVVLQLFLGVIFIGLFMLGITVITVLTEIFAKKVVLESLSLSVILIYLNVLFFLFLALITPFSFVCITSIFFGHKEKQGEEIPQIEKIKLKPNEKRKEIIKLLQALIIVATVMVSCIYVYLVRTGRVNFNIEYVKSIDVTAHRGASAMYPENSLSAFEGAVELGANWIELDVQQTKDSQIIIMHDTNLKRTTGKDVNIWEVTYEELTEYEIGSWFSTEFTGEPIRLLSEVLEFAKQNNIRLNIELKPTGHEENFEQNVIDIIREFDFADKCVVTSQVYEVLKNIKAYDPEIYTVYVMSVAYGNIYKLKAADSFSIKYSFITDSLVSTVHNAGKDIYAWTVNSEYQVKQMIDLNVDNIITDNVTMAQRCIYSKRTSNFVVQMVDKILGFHLDFMSEAERKM